MKLHNPSHPSEILLNYYLDNPSFVVSSGKANLLRHLILEKSSINKGIADILAGIFQTSSDFWLNLQKQYDKSKKEEPLEDKSILCDTMDLAIISLQETGRPSHYQDMYLLSEQSYKYLISNLTKDEEWDLGWLGASEKYAIAKKMPKALVEAIDKLKTTKSVDYVKEKFNKLTTNLLNN